MDTIISLIALIVFFVMAINLGSLVQLNRTIKEQNFKIIDLLRQIAPPDRLSDEDKAKAFDAINKKKI